MTHDTSTLDYSRTLKKTIRTRFQFHQWRRLFHASFYQEQVGLPSPKTPNEFCELAECWHGIGLVQMAVENVSEVYNSILYSASVFNRLAVQMSIVDYVDEGLRRVTSASVLQIGVYRRVASRSVHVVRPRHSPRMEVLVFCHKTVYIGRNLIANRLPFVLAALLHLLAPLNRYKILPLTSAKLNSKQSLPTGHS